MIRTDAIATLGSLAAAYAQGKAAPSGVQKQAGLGDLFKGALRFGRSAVPAAGSAAMRAGGAVAPLPGRTSSILRPLATTAGVGAAGYVGSGHIANQFRTDPVTSAANAGNHQQLADIYRESSGQADSALAPLYAAHQTALQNNDFARANMLRQRLTTGNYNMSDLPQAGRIDRWLGRESPEQRANRELAEAMSARVQPGGHGLMSLISPWTHQPTVGTAQHRQRAVAAQQAMQGAYDQSMQRHMGNPVQIRQQVATIQQQLNDPRTLPADRQMLQSQLAQMQTQLANPATGESTQAANIARMMRDAGMVRQDYRGPQAFGSGAPSGWVPPGHTWQSYAAQIPQQTMQGAFVPPPAAAGPPTTNVNGWSF